MGRLTKTTSPLGRVETLTYDAAGTSPPRTTPKGEKWVYAFNALNEPTTTTAPRDRVESRTYDAHTVISLSATNQRRQTRHDLSRTTARGRPVTTTDAFGTTTFVYDADQPRHPDRSGRQSHPAGARQHGRVTSIEIPAGEITQFVRDNSLDQLLSVTAADGSTQPRRTTRSAG